MIHHLATDDIGAMPYRNAKSRPPQRLVHQIVSWAGMNGLPKVWITTQRHTHVGIIVRLQCLFSHFKTGLRIACCFLYHHFHYCKKLTEYPAQQLPVPTPPHLQQFLGSSRGSSHTCLIDLGKRKRRHSRHNLRVLRHNISCANNYSQPQDKRSSTK